MWNCTGWKKYGLAWKKWKSKGFCDWACGWGVWSVFFLNCFWWTRAPFFVFILLCHPSENSLQWSTIPDDSPSKDRQSTVGWGTRDCRFTVWWRYQWATTAPKWANTAPIMSRHCSPMSHRCSLVRFWGECDKKGGRLQSERAWPPEIFAFPLPPKIPKNW